MKNFGQKLDKAAFNMDDFKIKILLISFTLKKSFIFQFLLIDVFFKDARIFQISFGYSVRDIKISRSPHPLGVKDIRATQGNSDSCTLFGILCSFLHLDFTKSLMEIPTQVHGLKRPPLLLVSECPCSVQTRLTCSLRIVEF